MRAEVVSDHGSDSGLEDGLLELQRCVGPKPSIWIFDTIC
jgi:hypothetical protein